MNHQEILSVTGVLGEEFMILKEEESLIGKICGE